MPNSHNQNTQTKIPPITHPLGLYWEQPDRNRILLDEKYAVMDLEVFEELLEYSYSNPTGKYLGKMWKGKQAGRWFLFWYDKDADPAYLAIPNREILLIENVD